MSTTARRLWISMGTLICAADLLVKHQMKQMIAQRGGVDGVIELLPFLDLRSVQNKGVAFGILADANVGEYLVWFSFAVCALVVVWVFAYKPLTHAHAFICALVFGGGLGNGLDRHLNGSVYDFVDLHLGDLHWPAFNVADMAISLAIMILLYMAFFGKGNPKE